MSTSDSDRPGNNTLVIALSTVLSVLGAGAIVAAACFCARRKRGASMFKRGITPIGDEEIATWKMDRGNEKNSDRYTTRPHHTPNASTSTRKTSSVIQYQSGARPSLEPISPRSFINNKFSLDLPLHLPQLPDAAVIALAPNARSGLTDETVPGDDPFLPSPRRYPSRLQKLPPKSPTAHGRSKGSRSSSIKSFADGWPGGAEASPRGSKDIYPRRTHSRIYSSSSIPPRLSFGDVDTFTGLSPPPSRRNDVPIGQALG
ncbi:hypothetical protein F5X99DRAFT_288124 [Biscogniauxia marginata]|nr:hypothetical protein F5X99DRAFT_288124 [Biscogniauxia marginata]